MNRLFSLAFFALSMPAMAGEPLLIPDFTPGTTSEFSLAFMLKDQAITELNKDGNIILTTEAVRPIVGSQLDACADVDWCPYAPLQQIPARVAMVVKVKRDAGRNNALFAEVTFYEQGDPTPMDTWEHQIVPGQEDQFARELRIRVQDLLSLLGPAPADDLMKAVALVNALNNPKPVEPVGPVTPVGPITQPVRPVTPPVGPTNPPVGPPVSGDLDVDYDSDPLASLLEGTDVDAKHVAGSEKHFRKSRLDARDWMFKASPHAGRVIVEVRGGYGIGDVSRSADVRVDLDSAGNKTSYWFQEGPEASQAPRGGLAIGYAPLTFLDITAAFSMQYGQKSITTGWTQNGGGGQNFARASVNAVQGDVLGRLRFIVPTGPVKPYAFAGGGVRFWDGYEIQGDDIDYDEPPGGYMFSGLGGAGLMFDAAPIVGFFVEGAYTQHVGVRAANAQKSDGAAPSVLPPAAAWNSYTIAIEGGIQFRL